ncbi:CDP-alcohol phosphatidyltransferase family protein [Duncaniella muris]|uniref:CDP-alcohol phosphatidyltransferase n=1 Tax=Duncaniella muris TaxID=2094150 RepID=A0A2V1IM30_9BACT|nr:CDP-alcohol phosphatidyltransferase family protein [Duncaniella muris]PWB04139.1 CDP-alcohol phosphatidyltransferase [Duncaniella muris]
MKQSLKDDYRRSLKSMDTEEGIDLAFYRPIGYMWARLAARFGVSPNAITIAAIFLGIGAGVLFYFPDLWINVAGMLLLVWANSFDSADGQLARMTHSYSRIGRILDGLCGDFWFAAIYIAIVLRENSFSPFFSEHHWILWLTAAVTGMCHTKQAAMADYYRQFHLYFLKGEDGSELDSAPQLRRQLEDAGITWRRHFWKRLSMAFYLAYTRQQEATAPAMQALCSQLRERFPNGRIPQSFREDFRRASLPLMKFTNILSFNWRVITLFTALFIGQPWLYFLVELTVFNALLVYMIIRHEKICKRFTNSLRNGLY